MQRTLLPSSVALNCGGFRARRPVGAPLPFPSELSASSNLRGGLPSNPSLSEAEDSSKGANADLFGSNLLVAALLTFGARLVSQKLVSAVQVPGQIKAIISTVIAAHATLTAVKTLWSLPGRIWACFKPKDLRPSSVAAQPGSAPGITEEHDDSGHRPSVPNPNWLLHAGFVGSVAAMLCFPAAAAAVIAAAPAVLTSGAANQARSSITLASQAVSIISVLQLVRTIGRGQVEGTNGSVQHASFYRFGNAFNVPFGHEDRTATDNLVLMNIVIYLYDVLRGKTNEDSLAGTLLLDKDKAAEGEVWRLITSAFVHANGPHIYLNMTAISSIGPFVEYIFNGPRFLAIYLTSAVCGGLASWVANPIPALGASGALYGLYGASAMFLQLHRDILQYFCLGGQPVPARPFDALVECFRPDITSSILIAIMERLGILGKTDHTAHIGGAVGGALAAYLLGPRIFLTFYEVMPAAGDAAAGGAAAPRLRAINNPAELQEIVNGGGAQRIQIGARDQPPFKTVSGLRHEWVRRLRLPQPAQAQVQAAPGQVQGQVQG